MTNKSSPASGSGASGPGMHDRLTWPLIAAVVFAIGASFWSEIRAEVPFMIEGCKAKVKPTVQLGEDALMNGDLARAGAAGEQALMMAPGCRCGHLLLAKVELRQMQAATVSGKIDLAWQAKKNCFAHVISATAIWGATPELDALREACQEV